jgi:hypothetical protein
MIKILKSLIVAFLIIGCFPAMIGYILYVSGSLNQTTYDCNLAEMHPDYPAKVKEECRKLRDNKNLI